MNKNEECLGFGRVMINVRGEIDMDKIAVKNILDVGDFLRREKKLSTNKSKK
jgi:ribosome biogenesis protein Nip4